MLGHIFTFVTCCAALALAWGGNPSSENCTWKYIEQPLSHFERASVGTYQQRLCVYDKYWMPNEQLPVFLYTGNESPVEEYVDNTGLMWTLAEKYNALIVFAEHRYFGKSIPNVEGVNNCISYLTSAEALADYASLSNRIRREWGGEKSAIIAFGGSYGGMLASWMRIMYPSAIDGAIAASAPVWGFPLNSCPVDGSAQVVSYSASAKAGAAPKCASNLKSAYVLISDIGSTAEGRDALSTGMNLCTPLKSAQDIPVLLNYLQSPLFNLAEGSYPFPSDYITFALTGTDAELPAWAMTVMCEPLGADFGAKISGDEENVRFTVSIGNVSVIVDWDQLANNGYSTADVAASGALSLAGSVAQAIQVWYNVTEDLLACIDWSPSSVIGTKRASGASSRAFQTSHSPRPFDAAEQRSVERKSGADSTVCTAKQEDVTPGNAWNILTCNEGINLVNWRAQGVGQDMYWPPNLPRGYTRESIIPGSLAYCSYLDAMGLYGSPSKPDDWSFWLDTLYGGDRMQYVTNIFYSNGNLDPWMPAGVTEVTPADPADMNSIMSVIIDMGGHHLDLFFPTENDPQSVKTVRAQEEEHIKAWIEQVKESHLRKDKNLAKEL